MALTDNRTQLQDCEAVGDVAGDSTADPQSNTSEAGVVIQGTNALQFQVTNAQEYLAYDLDSAGSTFNLDLSDSTIYAMVKDNLHDSFANLGGQIVLGDTADGVSTTIIGYAVTGYDVIGLPYEKKYSAMKLDVSVVVASPGVSGTDFFQHNGTEANLDQTIIKQVGYGSIHLIKGQGTIPNTFFDGIYYIANDSYAASITGGTVGTPETMPDLVGDDITVGAGMFSNPKGTEYDIFVPTEWGAATGDTYFEGTDEQWIYMGDNGGGHAVGATHFPMRLLGGTGTNSFAQTRVSNINIGTRAQFDWSHASFDIIALAQTQWIDFGQITCPGVDADKNCDASTFINGDIMLQKGMNMDGNTWIGATNTNGAIEYDAQAQPTTNVNATFISDGTGHAMFINIDSAGTTTLNLTGYTVDGFAGQSGTAGNRVFYIDNPSDGDVIINISGGNILNQQGAGEGWSYELAAGTASAVTINNNITLTFTPLISGSDVSVFLAGTNTPIQSTDSSTGSFAASVPASTSLDYKIYKEGYEVVEQYGVSFTVSQDVLPNQQINRNWRPTEDET